ncbi:serine hydrolase [Portibacter marinus]|uniref:serine hydrolase n=1 Tax=Portibacter marinus TaxID=2898660 RepID=UPI001F204F0C|nr:serine hydrolase domain-containing protein [Portibacter marinus]
MKRNVLVFMTISLLYSAVFSQSETNQIILERMESKNIPGIAFLIAKDGKILDQGYYGKANLEVDADITEIHFNEELKFKPGTDASYSSVPFVLGVVIEKITGQYYGDYMNEVLLKPLSLNETYIDDPIRIIPHRVSGYLNYDPEIMKTRVSGMGNGYLMAPRAYGRADVGNLYNSQ